MLVNLENHPFVSKTVAVLRDKNTEPPRFRQALRRLGEMASYEIAKELEVLEREVESPLGIAKYVDLKDDIAVVAILRAALPMAEGVLNGFEYAHMGFFSASREEMIDDKGRDFKINVAYRKLPEIKNHITIVVDPMLATASTLLQVISTIKAGNPKRIFIVSAIASKFGVERILEKHPDVEIYAAAVDEQLNEMGYIVPGLGDAGDRAFNTHHH